jgi:pimeloyl-ACP methyl ester carboxylesterase
VKQRLIHGLLDKIVPLKQSQDYEVAARRRGDDVELVIADEAGHFDLISPQSSTWPAVQEALRALLQSGGPKKHAAVQNSHPAVNKTVHASKPVH